MKVTFTTVPKSAAKYGMSTMGRLWKELHLQGLARRRDMQRAQRCWSHKKLTNRLESFDFFLCRWKYVHLPFTSACPSRQLKCTLSQLLRIHMTFYETVMLIIVMWSGGCCFCCYRYCCCCWRWKAAGPSLTKRFLFFHLTTPFFLSFLSACLLCLFQD